MYKSCDWFSGITRQVNALFANKEPWQVASITAVSLMTTIWIWEQINHDETISSRTKKKFFKLIRMVPAIQRKIDDEIAKVSDSMEKTVRERTAHLEYFTTLPLLGLSNDELLEHIDKYLSLGEYKWKEGRVSGAVYNFNDELCELVSNVYKKTAYTNPLHADIFPGINKMEAEVVRMCAVMFNGDDETVGTMTTGGTESLIMACKAYRDYGREINGIHRPNIVMPRTAHVGFDKAAQYFNIHVNYVDIDPVTTKVNIKRMSKAINKNTVMLIGSAPNFPYGTMDDIQAIAALGLKHNIPVHVDACLGGFLIPFMKRAGYPLPPFDFRVKGVTSISADPHKYGFTPKGCSIVLYSHKKYRHHQYTMTTDWPGGVYGSPTVNGSRAGGSIAACWATMLHFGIDGYVEATKRVIDTTRYIERYLRQIKGIYIFGTPATSVIAIGSRDFDILRLSDALCSIGWNLNTLQFPSGIHICVTMMHTMDGMADQFIKDVTAAVAELMKNPEKPIEGKMALYGQAQTLSDRSLVAEITRCFIDSMYFTPAAIKNTK
ncbi:sphingosine-1-phosphate lyase [Sitodiplosis mosellana]|uniref:sphingosine-1-phosphate lyase n=1 Tax=Sitodiplosis mosellana TaxID=263140 RepID=UPI0024451FBA|nr:sphingosine-1-phosphate lyase [Sitodiplosis mosellana]